MCYYYYCYNRFRQSYSLTLCPACISHQGRITVSKEMLQSALRNATMRSIAGSQETTCDRSWGRIGHSGAQACLPNTYTSPPAHARSPPAHTYKDRCPTHPPLRHMLTHSWPGASHQRKRIKQDANYTGRCCRTAQSRQASNAPLCIKLGPHIPNMTLYPFPHRPMTWFELSETFGFCNHWFRRHDGERNWGEDHLTRRCASRQQDHLELGLYRPIYLRHLGYGGMSATHEKQIA